MKTNSCKKSCYSGGSSNDGAKTHEKTCSFLIYTQSMFK